MTWQKNRSLFLLLLPAAIIFLVSYLFRGFHFEDDSYIFYRYAVNWAEGYGPVFNAGEYVEGYSSFLWTAVLAAGSYLGFDLESFAPVANLFIGIACLVLLGIITDLVPFSKRRIMVFLVTLFCALSYGFYYYGANGMDATIFSFVLLLSVLIVYRSVERGKLIYSLFPFLLLNLVRAEGFMYSFALLFVLSIYVLARHKSYKRDLILTIIAYFILTGSLFLLRHNIYGEWMPATVSAKGYATFLLKSCISEGSFDLFKKFLSVILSGIKYELFLILLGAWFPFIMLLIYRKEGNLLLWLIAASISVNIFVSVWAGGDYFPYKRHFIPVLPIMAVFLAWSLDIFAIKLWKDKIYLKAMVSIIVVVMSVAWAGYFINPASAKKVFYSGSKHTDYLRRVGIALHETSVPTTLLTNMIGAISYHAGSDVYVRDILGLTDIHNAKSGEVWGFRTGFGACGRSDYEYSFATPFDIFFYNSHNLHKKFISFCNENALSCTDYRYLKSSKWPDSSFYIIANIKHPAASVLMERFNAVTIPINDKLRDMI